MKIIEKKDMFYWIVILVIINIGVLTVRLGDNTNVVDYLSFAGTITSILLSAIAIFYSFYQSFISLSATEKLNDSANKITDVTSKIDYSTKTLENAINSVSNLEDIVKSLDKRVYDGLQNTKNDISSKLESFYSNFQAQGSSQIVSNGTVNINKLLKEMFSNNFWGACDVSYYILKNHQNHMTFESNLKELIQLSHLNDEIKKDAKGIFYTYLVMFMQMNLITVDHGLIPKIDDTFKTEIETFYANSPESYSYIDAIFSKERSN